MFCLNSKKVDTKKDEEDSKKKQLEKFQNEERTNRIYLIGFFIIIGILLFCVFFFRNSITKLLRSRKLNPSITQQFKQKINYNLKPTAPMYNYRPKPSAPPMEDYMPEPSAPPMEDYMPEPSAPPMNNYR